jgi:hypothetical protein
MVLRCFGIGSAVREPTSEVSTPRTPASSLGVAASAAASPVLFSDLDASKHLPPWLAASKASKQPPKRSNSEDSNAQTTVSDVINANIDEVQHSGPQYVLPLLLLTQYGASRPVPSCRR